VVVVVVVVSCRWSCRVVPALCPPRAQSLIVCRFPFQSQCRRSKRKDEPQQKKDLYKTIFKEASTQITKVSTRGLIEAFGQTEDKKAPELTLPDGAEVPALMPRKGSHLQLDAAVWKYFVSSGSPGLTGYGTTGGGTESGGKAGGGKAGGGDAQRSTRGKKERYEQEAVKTTLSAYGALKKGEAKEFLKDKALEVR